MLDQSKLELDKTVEQLINKYQGNEIEGRFFIGTGAICLCDYLSVKINFTDNEWKTRYQTQCQINEQLEKQRIMLQDKLQNFRESTKSGKIYKMMTCVCYIFSYAICYSVNVNAMPYAG